MNRAVITGIGAVAPNGINWPAFRDAVLAGVSGVTRVELFDASGLKTQIAGQARGFDATAHLPEGETDMRNVSRAVPLALAAGAEALADAGIEPRELTTDERRRMGVCIGSGGGAAEFTERQYAAHFTGEGRLSIYNVPSSTTGTLSSELSIRHVLLGLSHVISDGCTSSSDAIGYALGHIRSGKLDRVLTGGVDATVTRAIMTGFDTMRVMASRWNDHPERASRPFDRGRGGFVLAEGAWMFMLEREDSARARGAKIYAEVLGYGASCEAYHRVKLESPEESARAMRLALEDAGLKPDAVGHVQAHGTSTALNDKIETGAIKLALGDHARRVPVSSVKSMIGHPQGASGAAGLAAAIAGLTRHVVTPTINFDDPDPECDLDIATTLRPLDRDTLIINTLSFGSKNAALVIGGAR